jgi:chemotaxis protein histidine kinase CheA|tara:strand:+ start:739 stop:2235 length:1497 start_codon:yes stop_codon:yes gene_type:complete
MSEINIYKQEIADGLSEAIAAQNSIAYCSPATISKEERVDSELPNISSPDIDKLLANSNPDQIDLYYLESVLVSTGWNKNDDVFQPGITWAARTTPEDKQFNFMHDENDIIGHITSSYVIDRNGNKVSADAECPESFDIITEAVLYNSWTGPENRERMQQIIAEIEDGKWFVSMECLFAGFDYALVDPKGESKLLERNESSAFLTKHLRSYGGTGEYEGYKIGRALRNISFSGKGLVSKPANPRSIILNSSKAFLVDDENKLTEFSIGDKEMSDNQNLLEKQVADLQAELKAAIAQNEAMKKDIEEAKDKEFASTIQAFEGDIADKAEAITALEEASQASQTKIAELEEALAQKDEELAEAHKTLEDWKQKERQQKRLASLVDAGFDAEEAEESLALYDALEDEAFDAIVAKWYDKKKKKEDEEKKDAEAEAEVEVEAEASETSEADESEEAEATEEMFDEVESSEATLVEAEEDDLQDTRASLAEWLSENVLRTNTK